MINQTKKRKSKVKNIILLNYLYNLGFPHHCLGHLNDIELVNFIMDLHKEQRKVVDKYYDLENKIEDIYPWIRKILKLEIV